MSTGVFNQALLDRIRKGIRENKENDKLDWFIMGYLYAQPNNLKSLEQLIQNLKSIALLCNDDLMSPEESDEMLLKMINKNVQASNGEPKKVEPAPKKAHIEQKDDISEELSYKSDGTENLSAPDSDLDKPRKTVVVKKKLEQNPNTGEWNVEFMKKNPENVVIEERSNRNLKRLSTREEEELSLALIRQLEDEEGSMLKDRKKKEDEMNADVDCGICLSGLYDESFVPLENCSDMFHENCLAEFCKSEIGSRNFPIKCPSGCGNEVSRVDMQQVLNKDMLSKFDEYSLQKYVDTHADEISCCPTADCKYAFERVEGEDDDELNCPLCKKCYCLNCRVEMHKGMSCKEYKINTTRDENDIKFEKFVKGKKFKQCSKCKFWVEKNKGCDHMVCRCKYEFCYKCGGKYMDCECTRKMKEQLERRRQMIANQNRNNKKRRK